MILLWELLSPYCSCIYAWYKILIYIWEKGLETRPFFVNAIQELYESPTNQSMKSGLFSDWLRCPPYRASSRPASSALPDEKYPRTSFRPLNERFVECLPDPKCCAKSIIASYTWERAIKNDMPSSPGKRFASCKWTHIFRNSEKTPSKL